MKTYQDLLAVGKTDKDRMEFVRSVISDHKGSAVYRMALVAQQYYRGRNVTITIDYISVKVHIVLIASASNLYSLFKLL